MNKPTREVMVAILAVGAAAVALYLAFGRRSEKINLGTYEVLGAVTAEETARLIENKGRVVVVVRDTGPDKNPSVEAELAAFQQTLKQHPALSLVVERLPVTPTLMMATGGGLPAENLFKWIEKHAKVDAVVMFLGFPQMTDAELAALKRTGVKTVVVSSFRPGYQQLLERQAIQVAIVPRPEVPSAGGPTPTTLREKFDQEYLLLKGETPRSP
jgi:hypothetical protein